MTSFFRFIEIKSNASGTKGLSFINPYLHASLIFAQVFCTSFKGNTYGTKDQLTGDNSSGLVKLTKYFFYTSDLNE